MVSGRRTSRPWLPYTLAVIAGFGVITAAYLIVSRADDPPGRADCVPLEVSSSTEKAELIEELADRYNGSDRRSGGGACATVTVHGLNSGQAMNALDAGWSATEPGIPEPQVWLPTSSLWTDQLRLRDEAAGRSVQTPDRYPSIANSPLVIAMPQPQGEAVQRNGRLGWGEILGMSGQRGWSALGHPEWGPFTFRKDNPRLSTSGLAATIATYYAAVARASDLTEADLARPEVTQFIRRIEANVSHYDDDVIDLLRDLAATNRSGTDPTAMADMSAVVMQEELVYLYNEGRLSPNGKKPAVPLVAVHPREGTFNLDHPYVVLPSASPRQREAAEDFRAFLQEAPQQREFDRYGFRDHERVASDPLLASVRADDAASLTYFDPPAPEVVNTILDSWGTLRKKANILIAIDTSGSMTKRIEGGTRFKVATDSAKDGLALLNSEDRVALWSFSSETSRRPKAPYAQEMPLGGFDQPKLTAKLDSLHAEGGTALYATVRAAHQHMRKNYDRNRINAVVVLTDGKNEHPTGGKLPELLRDVAYDPDRPVKIFCIAFDQDSDFKTLDQIAKASTGKAFNATDPKDMDEAFVKLVSSF